jgi:hypothetical protein
LLDRVSNAREELVAIERNLERLRADIAKAEKQRDVPGKRRYLILELLYSPQPVTFDIVAPAREADTCAA